MKLVRLNQEDFVRLADMTNMEAASRTLAEEVLVNGRPMADVASQYGLSKQRVHFLVGRIEKKYAEDKEGAAGIVRVELDLPECIALEMGLFSDLLQRCNDPVIKEAAIAMLMSGLKKTKKTL